MRSAFVVVVVVALVFVAVGAVNHSLAFDIDYGLGAVYGVSTFWITLVAAAVLFVTGLVSALLARASAVAARRKLESELEATYKRLRAAEGELMLATSSTPPLATPSPEERAVAESPPLPAAQPSGANASVSSADEAADDDKTAVLPSEATDVAQPRPDDT